MKGWILIFMVLGWAGTLWGEEVAEKQVGAWYLAGVVQRRVVEVKVITDPKVEWVVCHFAYVVKKLSFEDPSDSTIACRRVGPVRFKEAIEEGPEGEVVFADSRNIFFRTFRIRRVYDKSNHSLVYVSYTKEIIDGSNKLSISTVV